MIMNTVVKLLIITNSSNSKIKVTHLLKFKDPYKMNKLINKNQKAKNNKAQPKKIT